MTRSWFPRTVTLLMICAGLALICQPAWCQEETTATDTDNGSGDDTQLLVPPPVSNQSYPTEFAGDNEQNYLRGSFTLSSAYSSNITNTAQPVSDMSYSFWPTITLNRVTSQLQLALSYSPGFTIYQHTSGYNQVNQNMNLSLQYRINSRLSLSMQEGFQKSSNIFDRPTPLAASTVSGAPPVTGLGIISPLADQITNTTSVQLVYQLGAASSVGVTGAFGKLNYLNSQQSSGLYNSETASGSAFYSHRLGERFYIGANYQYQNTLSFQTDLPSTRVETQTVFGFLSIYLKPTLSVSVSGGPQHYAGTQPPFVPVSSWSPLLIVSGAWQGQRTTLAASYSRIVSGAGGLSGVYHSTTVGVSAGWKLSRNWNAGVGANYGNNTSLSPLVFSSGAGRTILGTVSAQRTLGERASLQFGYNWTSQNYHQIAPLASIPNINRVFVSLTYQFTKPLQKY
jgi:hypothetical protein